GGGQVGQSEMQRRLSGCDRQRTDAAFEFGDAFFKNGGRWIGNPAVAVTFGFEIEQGGTVIGAVEGGGDGLIDRNSDRLGRRIGVVAGGNCNLFVRICSPLRFRYALLHAFCSPLLFNAAPSRQQ